MMAKRICSECEFCIDFKCTKTKRKNNTIPLRITQSPNWCPFKKKARRTRGKSPRAKMTKKLDDLWREAIKLLACDKCELTGKPSGIGRGKVHNAHHIVGRSNFRTRWLVANGAYLSAGKHTLNADSAHKDPIHFLEQMIEKRGKKWYDDLQKEAYLFGGGVKHTMEDLEEIELDLKSIIKKVKDGKSNRDCEE